MDTRPLYTSDTQSIGQYIDEQLKQFTDCECRKIVINLPPVATVAS